MGNPGMKIKHAKRRGEWAELCFMARAAEHGLCISKPWGETAHYDFVVETGGKLLRVQVKSTFSNRKGKYRCGVHGSRGAYVADAFDFIAAYLVPENLWYIIPAEKIEGKEAIMISPKLETAKYRDYREAWKLLGAAEDVADHTSDAQATSVT
jgi:hypothetical protein